MRRRVTHHIARILRGAHPRDLPIEQPTTFDFVVNQAVARSLGIVIPPALRAPTR